MRVQFDAMTSISLMIFLVTVSVPVTCVAPVISTFGDIIVTVVDVSSVAFPYLSNVYVQLFPRSRSFIVISSFPTVESIVTLLRQLKPYMLFYIDFSALTLTPSMTSKQSESYTEFPSIFLLDLKCTSDFIWSEVTKLAVR